MLHKKIGHHVVGFDGFGHMGVVPEGVGERVEDHEVRVNSGLEIGAMQVHRSTQQQVARAGDEERGRQAVKVRVNGREYRVFGIGLRDIFRVVRARLGRVEMAG